jgi:dolichol-phosphate mannosyltransferase
LGALCGSAAAQPVPTRMVALVSTEVIPPRRKLTIVIPCFNERETILELIDQVKRVDIDKLVVVVDNASTDGTRELLRSLCKNERALSAPDFGDARGLVAGQRMLDGDGFTLVLQPTNLKKGASVKTGLALANSEYFICQDADLEYDPSDIVRLLEHAERTGAAAVFGSRLLRRPGLPIDAFHLGRVTLTKLFRGLYDCPITDVATCYKLMRTEVARSLDMQAQGFDLDFEIPAKLARLRHAVAEVPIRYFPRDAWRGKKLRLGDGLSAARTLVKLRLFLPPKTPPTQSA